MTWSDGLRKSTGLLIGAGASYELGMPLVWELTTELKNWLTAEKLRGFDAGWRQQGGGHPDEVIDDFASVLERSDLHYQAMLGYLETQWRRQRSLAQHYHGLYSWLVQMIYHLLYARQINNADYLARHLPIFDGIKSLTDGGKTLRIFSLNHDVMIEAIAARLGISLHSGFGPATITLPLRDEAGILKGRLNAAVLDEATIDRGAMPFPNPPEPGIYLLKIHGALDVFAFNDGKDLLKLVPDGDGPEGVIAALRAANEDLRYIHPGLPSARVGALNEIAYADDDGVMQFLRRTLLAGAFKFDVRRSQVLPVRMLEHFRANLNFVGRLICIGYGFGDLHINTALREWLDASAHRSLEIVNPGIREIPSGLLHLAPQITLSQCGAADWFDGEAGIERPQNQILLKQVSAAMRKLGPVRGQKASAAYLALRQQSAIDRLIAHLQALPKVGGKPDLGSIEDTKAIADKLAADLKTTEYEIMTGLLPYLEAELLAPAPSQ